VFEISGTDKGAGRHAIRIGTHLSSTTAEVVTVNEIEELLGISKSAQRKHGNDLRNHPVLADVMQQRGWAYLAGRRGRGSDCPGRYVRVSA
jgi:DNA-binding IscR family transcriptional regulator